VICLPSIPCCFAICCNVSVSRSYSLPSGYVASWIIFYIFVWNLNTSMECVASSCEREALGLATLSPAPADGSLDGANDGARLVGDYMD
jgi:hypothetical protein